VEAALLSIRTKSFVANAVPGVYLSIRRFFQAPLIGEKKYRQMKLYVGNLAFKTTDEDLQNLFSQAGTVNSTNIITDRESGFSRGFGFIEMSSQEEGESAISMFNGKDIDGRALNVNEAKPRENRGGNGGRGGFGGGNRGSHSGNSGW
jgi:RNA recognition motif-containing protein